MNGLAADASGTSRWLSRVRLRREAPIAALASLLVPDDTDARVAAGHKLVWSLFADDPDRRRDFLWREEAPGRYLVLSPRPPVSPAGLFVVEPRPFEPVLAVGDRLGFALRANAVISRSDGPGRRGRPSDVVMDALHRVPAAERANRRPELVVSAGQAWLERQGERHGFRPDAIVAVDSYDRRCIPRPDAAPAIFGSLDFEGALTVTDPDSFLASLLAGFGRAKAFGFGLMLIRRLSRA